MAQQDEDVETKAVVARIEGRVQGVWFRGWTVMLAHGRTADQLAAAEEA